ncbi:hypothetical protein TruAng_007947 [Truncatella angustata]|nr:hypothetical protein TruAng_007947 [Truncatella angustata]
MACNCRTSSLRVFVQSLTRVQLSAASSRSASLLDSRVPGAYSSNGALRSFTAVSAARYPRQSLRASALTIDTETTHNEPSHDTLATSSPDDTTSSYQPANVSSAEVDQARRNHAIMDLSADAIDALAADLERTVEGLGVANDDLEHETDVRRRQKPEFSGPSRLKRSKIMPTDRTLQTQAQANPIPRKRETWQIQKEALKEKFPEGWNPRKKLSPDALDGIRALHTQYPQIYTTDALANHFQVSVEAIRRILKSKWRPNVEEDEDRQQRWFNRGKNIWSQMAELGTKPPKKWRAAGVSRDARFNKPKGHRTEYPYVPKWKEKESAQKKLGDSLL